MTGGGVSAYSQRPSARDTESLVLRHAELVKRIAYHLAGRLPASVEVDDLIQAGMLGLLEAASNYSAGRGASFETYAGIRIRGAMLDGLTLFGIGASWGGYESLVLPFDCRDYRTATTPDFKGPTVRIHIGLENIEDLKADLDAGFARLRAAS